MTDFEDWKKNKKAKGEWLSSEDYKLKKDLERKEELERELEKINRRLNPRPHTDLEKDFEEFYRKEIGVKRKRTEEGEEKSVKRTEEGEEKSVKRTEEGEEKSVKRTEEGEEKSVKRRRAGEEKSVKRREEEKKTIKREIVLDTETTGLGNNDKIVEISMIELVDGIKTGRRYHKFINPEINITKKATQIHKITNERLKDCVKFPEIAEDIIKFIGNATIIAHNAIFDMRMLNNELISCGWEKYSKNRFIDTLEISRYLFPKQKNNQDALCERFNIENHNRVNTGIHSAAEDTALLFLVYKELEKLLLEKKLTPYDFRKENTL